MYDIQGLKFSLQRLKCHLWGFIPSCLPTNEIVVEMLWENRLSFHNLLSISGGKKVENYWEIVVILCKRPKICELLLGRAF